VSTIVYMCTCVCVVCVCVVCVCVCVWCVSCVCLWRVCACHLCRFFQRGDTETQNGYTFCMLLGQVALTCPLQALLCFVEILEIRISV